MKELFFDTIIKNSNETIDVKEFMQEFYSSTLFQEFLGYHYPENIERESNQPIYPKKSELYYYLTNLNSAQLTYVFYGYWLGLSRKIIDTYANPNISYKKMSLVISLLETGIETEIVEREFINNISISNYNKLVKHYIH